MEIHAIQSERSLPQHPITLPQGVSQNRGEILKNSSLTSLAQISFYPKTLFQEFLDFLSRVFDWFWTWIKPQPQEKKPKPERRVWMGSIASSPRPVSRPRPPSPTIVIEPEKPRTTSSDHGTHFDSPLAHSYLQSPRDTAQDPSSSSTAETPGTPFKSPTRYLSHHIIQEETSPPTTNSTSNDSPFVVRSPELSLILPIAPKHRTTF